MNIRHAVVITLAAASLAVSGCRSLESIAPPVQGPVVEAGQASGHDSAVLLAGRQTYLTKCSTCHNLEPLDEYPTAKWQKVVPEMSKEAKLSQAEEQNLRAYVFAVRATIDQGRAAR